MPARSSCGLKIVVYISPNSEEMCAPMQIIVLFLVTVESSYVTVSIGEGMCVTWAYG